jgi:hypothetical protein
MTLESKENQRKSHANPPAVFPFSWGKVPWREDMSTLTIGTRRFETDEHLVILEAERLFKLSREQRHARVERAKTRIARAVASERDDAASAIIRHSAATLLSQGIKEI